jgi:hypothetical protein
MIQLADPQLDVSQEGNVRQEYDVRQQVMALMSSVYSELEVQEKRQENRYPFPYLIHLTPVADDGLTPDGKCIAVVGKHLSNRGLGFYHPKPLPYRRMIASLECNGRWLAFLIDVRWCRFTKQGWYESGGRFLQSVPSPVEDGAEQRDAHVYGSSQ